MGVSDVVVTRQMKRWHAVHTLEIVYRDAFNNQLNDRYQAKFQEYRELARDAREHTFQFGVGLALIPIPQAQPPVFSAVAGLIPRDHVLCAGVVGGGSRAGGSAERVDDLRCAGGKPAGGADGESAGGGDGVQRLSGADAGRRWRYRTRRRCRWGRVSRCRGRAWWRERRRETGRRPDIYISGGRMLRRG